MTEDQHDTSIAVFTTLVDILRAMRGALAAYLSELGPDWETVFFPDQVLQCLETRRAQRGTLSWSVEQPRPLIDFATFADLAELAAARPEAAAPFAAMAPNPQVLQVRLLELAAVSEKVTLGHGTVDQDLVMVHSFAQRLFQVLGLPAPPTRGGSSPARAAEPPGPPSVPPAAEITPPPSENSGPGGVAPEHAAKAFPHQAAGRLESTSPRPEAVPDPPIPVPRASVTASSARSQTQSAAEPGADRPRPTGVDSLPKVSEDDLLLALDKQNSTVVLRALYREIMIGADSMWTRAMIPTPRIWPVVRESAWYQDQFSTLGMRPVSDFFSIVESGLEAFGTSAPRDKMQAFLTEHGFSQTLVALRDFFQRQLK